MSERFHFRDGNLYKLFSIFEGVISKKRNKNRLDKYGVLLIDADQINGKTCPFKYDDSLYVTIAAASTVTKLDGCLWADLSILADNKKDESDFYLQMIAQRSIWHGQCVYIDIVTVDQALVGWIKKCAKMHDRGQIVSHFTCWTDYECTIMEVINARRLNTSSKEYIVSYLVNVIGDAVAQGLDKDTVKKMRHIKDAFLIARDYDVEEVSVLKQVQDSIDNAGSANNLSIDFANQALNEPRRAKVVIECDENPYQYEMKEILRYNEITDQKIDVKMLYNAFFKGKSDRDRVYIVTELKMLNDKAEKEKPEIEKDDSSKPSQKS